MFKVLLLASIILFVIDPNTYAMHAIADPQQTALTTSFLYSFLGGLCQTHNMIITFQDYQKNELKHEISFSNALKLIELCRHYTGVSVEDFIKERQNSDTLKKKLDLYEAKFIQIYYFFQFLDKATHNSNNNDPYMADLAKAYSALRYGSDKRFNDAMVKIRDSGYCNHTPVQRINYYLKRCHPF